MQKKKIYINTADSEHVYDWKFNNFSMHVANLSLFFENSNISDKHRLNSVKLLSTSYIGNLRQNFHMTTLNKVNYFYFG